MDPHLKNVILFSLTKHIFSHEYQRLQIKKFDLIDANFKAGGGEHGFIHRGVKYSIFLDPQNVHKYVKGPIHSSLVQEMEAFLADKQAIDFDKVRVTQALTLLLSECECDQDVRDALPEFLIDNPDINWKELQRTRPEAYTLLSNQRTYNQYLKLRELILYYLASKMLL